MISIVYVSEAESAFSREQLTELLALSRRNNEARGLTGVLLYRDGQFMQALEGEAEAVRERIGVISADPRHSAVREILDEDITERRFPDWSMGFRTAGDIDGLEGFNNFFERQRAGMAADEAATKVRLLLEWFRFRRS